MIKLRLAPVNTSAAVISPRGRLAREHGNGCFDPGPVVHRRRLKFDRRHRQRPEVSHPNREEGCGNGIEQEFRPVDAWRHLLQQPEPFSDDLKLDEGEARDIAPRTGRGPNKFENSRSVQFVGSPTSEQSAHHAADQASWTAPPLLR
jgi:hypothetical protein